MTGIQPNITNITNDQLLNDERFIGNNRVVVGRHGYYIYNSYDHYMGHALEKYGEYSEEEFHLLSQLTPPGATVIEVGANIGALTIPIARNIGAEGFMIAIEPQKIIFQMLCANMCINSFQHVECMWAGASDQAGSFTMRDMNYAQLGNYGGMEMERLGCAHGEGYDVSVITLDSLDHRLKALHLIKIDVEGMEAGVIRGAKNLIEKFRPNLYVENDRQEKSEELIQMIGDMGYEMYWHLPKLYNVNNWKNNPENIYPHVVSINMLCIPKEKQIAVTGFPRINSVKDRPW